MVKLIENRKLSIYASFFLFVVVVLTFMPAQGYVPIFRQTWIFLSLSVFFSFFTLQGFFKTRSFILLCLYFFVVLVNVLFGDDYFKSIIGAVMEAYLLLVPSLFFYYAISRPDGEIFAKRMVTIIFMIIMIETIASYSLSTNNSAIIRHLFSESILTGEKDMYLYPYYCLGLSNYILPHAIPMLIPPLVMIVRKNRDSLKIRLFTFILLVFSFWLVWLSGSMTVLLVSSFILLVSFLSTSNPNIFKQGKIVLASLILLPIISSNDVQLFVLEGLGDVLEGNVFFSEKIAEFKESLQSGQATGDLSGRLELYDASINEIIGNLLIGTNHVVGNHSAILDRVSMLGLVGFVPLVLFVYFQIKFIAEKIHRVNRIYYYESCFAGFLILLLKDMDDWEVFLFLFSVMPMMMVFPYGRQNRCSSFNLQKC